MAADPIAVVVREAGDSWLADVTVGPGGDATMHTVTVSRLVLERIAPNAAPDELVRASFAFLLEREPKDSILREFRLEVIGRYFSEYEREMATRFGHGRS